MYRYREDYDNFNPPTRKQQAFMDRNDMLPEDYQPDFYEAHEAIGHYIDHQRGLAPTPKQKWILQQQGQWREGMTRGEAFDCIRRLKEQEQKAHKNGLFRQE